MASQNDLSIASPHEDPEHEALYGFCRTGCAECDRLDREEYGLRPSNEVLAEGVMRAFRSIRGEGA